MISFLIGLAVAAGLLSARLSRVKKHVVAGGAASFLAVAAAFVGPWEGLRTDAYLDRIASPAVWTVCYGETRGVKAGDTYAPQECADKLSVALADYHKRLSACIPALPSQPEGVQVALVSWSYNVGTGAACGSTLAKLANAGNWPAACDQLPRWNKAGGKPVAGLSNRRAAEQSLCKNALKG